MTKERILKYLLNELSENEARDFETWVFESKENMQTFSDYKNGWSLAMAELEEEERSHLQNNYSEVLRRIKCNQKKRTGKISVYLRYAAAILLFAGVTAVLVNQLGKRPGPVGMQWNLLGLSLEPKRLCCCWKTEDIFPLTVHLTE